MKKQFLVKLFALIMCFAMLLCTSMLSGCKKEPLVLKESDTYIVISVTQKSLGSKSITLLEYMQHLKQDGELQFEADGTGMITAINGIANPQDWSCCWMLYTSDADNSNDGWGKAEYNGKIYGSAILGASDLIVKADNIYIWVYQSFRTAA